MDLDTSLNLDDTILNIISRDCDLSRISKSKKLPFPNRSSSSGIESLGSDSESNISKSNVLLSQKRLNDDSCRTLDKKIKLENKSISSKNTEDTAGVKVLEATDNKAIMTKSSLNEFDVFAKFMNCPNLPTTKTDIHSTESQHGRCSIFSTSTKVAPVQNLNKIDTKDLDNPMENENNKSINRKLGSSPDFPMLKLFKANFYEENEKSMVNQSVLYGNERNTSNKNKVDNIFDQIENSIYLMGDNNGAVSVPEEILDIIFSDDLHSIESGIQDVNNVKQESDKLYAASLDSSFGTVIKKALINNAGKLMQPSKHLETTLCRTFTEKTPIFNNHGSFYGLPSKVKDLVKQYKGIDELYEWQDECLKLPAVEHKKNLIYALPTSGGKTLVAEILMFREILCYKKNAIFILPYVSIVQEKVWGLSPFGVALDFLVEEYASSKGSYPLRKRRRKKSVYVATIEKALGIINSLIETGRLHEIGLIVVDELHLVGEEGRGATLEACLTKIMFLKATIQIVGMSATIGNIAQIAKFLDAEVYRNCFRPVELTEYVKCGKEIAKINWNYTKEEDLLIETTKVPYKYSDTVLKVDPDMLGALVSEVVPKDSCLIFCPSKKNCENVAKLLCKILKSDLKEYKKTEKEQLISSLKDESGELCTILEKSVQFGIAYHHSGLTGDERRIIEDGFRSGIIYVICCTSTLAAGVNLPAKRVILRSPFIGKDFINLSRYKQMVGRAGRAGLGEAGNSILIAQPQELPKVKNLLMSPMDQALSSMHLNDGRGLRHLLLSCISLGIANTRRKLQEVASCTLLSIQKEKLEVNIKLLTDKIIRSLFKQGALTDAGSKQEKPNTLFDVTLQMNTSTIQDMTISEENLEAKKQKKKIVVTNHTKLIVSQLGCAAIKGGLELLRAHTLYEDLLEGQYCLVLKGHLHLLYLVTPYETADRIKPNRQIYYDVLTKLKPDEQKVAKALGLDESIVVKLLSNQPIKNVPERVINRFYLTLMLNDLWNEMPIFQVAEKYQVDRGIVQNLMTSSATFASNVVNFCEELEEFWAYTHLLKGMGQRLSHCCIKELLPLMELPAVKQGRAKQLYNAGYKTLQSIAKANIDDLVESIEFMSNRVANQLIAASKMLLLERVENLREEAEDILEEVDHKQNVDKTIE